MRNLRDVELDGKRVLMRVDFNVPIDKQGNILDDGKMRGALSTIEHVLAHNGKLILMSHLGRPKGKPNPEYSLKELAPHLKKLLNGTVVNFAEDCVGPEVEEKVNNMEPGEVLLLENLRFHAGEEENDADFSRQLAALGDIYINDAFGSAHRAHASTVGVADYLPAYAGFLMEAEVKMIKSVVESPERPRMAIMGGAKIIDKLGLIGNLLEKMDIILIGEVWPIPFLRRRAKMWANLYLKRSY